MKTSQIFKTISASFLLVGLLALTSGAASAKEKFEYKLIPIDPVPPLTPEEPGEVTLKQKARVVQPGGNAGGKTAGASQSIVNTTKHNTKDRMTAPSDASAGAGAASGKKDLNAVNVK